MLGSSWNTVWRIEKLANPIKHIGIVCQNLLFTGDDVGNIWFLHMYIYRGVIRHFLLWAVGGYLLSGPVYIYLN